jgi:hypothetical protein
MIPVAEAIATLVGMLSLMGGYYHSSLSPVAIGCFVIGLLWLLSQWRRWSWVPSLGLVVFMGAAMLGLWIGLSPILMTCGVLFGLTAWDLADFSSRLHRAAPEDNLRKLENTHLVRLTLLGLVSLSLSLLAMFLHLQISFGWMFLLAFAVILGMAQLVKRLRRGE